MALADLLIELRWFVIAGRRFASDESPALAPLQISRLLRSLNCPEPRQTFSHLDIPCGAGTGWLRMECAPGRSLLENLKKQGDWQAIFRIFVLLLPLLQPRRP